MKFTRKREVQKINLFMLLHNNLLPLLSIHNPTRYSRSCSIKVSLSLTMYECHWLILVTSTKYNVFNYSLKVYLHAILLFQASLGLEFLCSSLNLPCNNYIYNFERKSFPLLHYNWLFQCMQTSLNLKHKITSWPTAI